MVADGDITQTATGVITTNLLGIRQEAGTITTAATQDPDASTVLDIVLDDANDVNTLAIDNTFATGVIVFHDTDDLTIGEVLTQTIGLVSFMTTTGIESDNGDVLIDAGGFLSITETINTRDGADTAIFDYSNGDLGVPHPRVGSSGSLRCEVRMIRSAPSSAAMRTTSAA